MEIWHGCRPRSGRTVPSQRQCERHRDGAGGADPGVERMRRERGLHAAGRTGGWRRRRGAVD
jgi:hypothetical protein